MPGSDLNEKSSNNGLPGFDQSPLLGRAGFRHAFFTRTGGASTGPFESLSFSTAVGDDPADVDENLRRAGALLGVEASRVLYLSQVHGKTAHFFDEVVERSHTITLEGDAIGGTRSDSAYGVRSADCVPILLADQVSGAVMAIHAGWRGVAGGVVSAGVERLRAAVGHRGELLAAIGPHISLAAFEVSDDVAAELEASCPVPGAVRRAGAAEHERGEGPAGHETAAKPHVNLRFIVTQQLMALGLPESAIDQVGGCTVVDRDRYFSFRRDGKKSGRHLSAIVPRPK